jgi:hypothetical protein
VKDRGPGKRVVKPSASLQNLVEEGGLMEEEEDQDYSPPENTDDEDVDEADSDDSGDAGEATSPSSEAEVRKCKAGRDGWRDECGWASGAKPAHLNTHSSTHTHADWGAGG